MYNETKLLVHLGQKIKNIRKYQGLTQEKLAELCEFDPTYINMLERGKRNLPFLTICKLAHHLNCSVVQLVE